MTAMRQDLKPLRWPTNAKMASHMRGMVQLNRTKSKSNKAEAWMAERLSCSPHKWSQQVQWGYRIFDFWCQKLGCAVEVDGTSHDGRGDYDAYRDRYNYLRSGIVVFRVRNFSEADASEVLKHIADLAPWQDRKCKMGIAGNTKAKRRSLVVGSTMEMDL